MSPLFPLGSSSRVIFLRNSSRGRSLREVLPGDPLSQAYGLLSIFWGGGSKIFRFEGTFSLLLELRYFLTLKRGLSYAKSPVTWLKGLYKP